MKTLRTLEGITRFSSASVVLPQTGSKPNFGPVLSEVEIVRKHCGCKFVTVEQGKYNPRHDAFTNGVQSTFIGQPFLGNRTLDLDIPCERVVFHKCLVTTLSRFSRLNPTHSKFASH